MPGHKFDCVQTSHMYVYKYMLNPACHKLGCIQLHMYMCQAQSFCQRGGHSWSPVWHLTCHRTSEPDIFLRSTTCRPLTSIALAKWKIDTHNCDWNIFLVPSPVLGILACDYRQTPTGREGKWTGGRFDTTNAWWLLPLAWQVSLNSGSHTSMNSSRNLESRNWGIRCIVIQELILCTNLGWHNLK